MRYLFDANSCIESDKKWYPIHRIPDYWDFLIFKAKQGIVCFLPEIYAEILGTQQTPRNEWAKTNKEILRNLKTPKKEYLLKALKEYRWKYQASTPTQGDYGSDLTTNELSTLQNIGDPYLIAGALEAQANKTPLSIVTMETSKPTADRTRSKIPDIAKRLNLSCISLFQALEELHFTTDKAAWR